MAAGGLHDPGGGDRQQSSYAERLKTNVSYDQRLKRNVLEIVLEKTEKDADMVMDQDCIARLIRSIGMDLLTQVEGYQQTRKNLQACKQCLRTFLADNVGQNNA